MRNVLVHEYVGVDLDLVVRAVAHELDDLAAFGHAISILLSSA